MEQSISDDRSVPVSAIVPTFNRGPLIVQSIDSILAQTTPPREIIVVDDGSTDDTAQTLRRYEGRIKLIRKENGGKSTALNLALTEAAQPYIWIFDDDDIACDDGLERLYSSLSCDPEAGLAYGTLDKFYGDWPSALSEPSVCYASQNRKALYLKLMQDFFFWQGAMLVRADCYRAVGPFDVRFSRSQDYEMALRLLRRFKSIAVPHVIFHQRHHRGERGPRHARFRARDTEAVWTKFNRLLFGEIYRSHRLEEFCCSTDGDDLTPRQRITALLQRASIMGRKGLWDKAPRDMTEAAHLAAGQGSFELNRQELTGLRAVFEHGSRSQFTSLGEARRFRAAVDRFDAATAARIRGNLLLPVTNRVRLMIRRPRKREEARQISYLAASLLNMDAVREYFGARRSEYRLHDVVAVAALS